MIQWGISNIFTVTVDNASLNDTASNDNASYH